MSVAVITGASRGIGADLAEVLSTEGYAVGLVARDQQRLDSVARELPGRSHAVAADVTDPEQVRRAVQSITEALGDIDVLVNNAGAREATSTQPWEADPADWWQVIDVNLRGVVLMTSAVLPGMIERGSGRIIDLTSGVAQRAEPRYSAYSVSKAAALRWMDNVVAALGQDSPVRIVAASPGLVHTDMTETMWGPKGTVEFGSLKPMRQFLRCFVAGDLDHLHGQAVHTAKDSWHSV